MPVNQSMVAAVQIATARPNNTGIPGAALPGGAADTATVVNAVNTTSGIASTITGNVVGFLQASTDGGSSVKNKWIQFNIVNGAIVNVHVRIGSKIAIEGNPVKFGQLPAAEVPATLISDQVGAGVLGVQAFSEISCSRPILITRIQITSSDTAQLNSAWSYNELQLDGTPVKSEEINISATAQLSDQRTDMYQVDGQWFIDSMHYFELLSYAAKTVIVKMLVEAWGNVAQFTQYGV